VERSIDDRVTAGAVCLNECRFGITPRVRRRRLEDAIHHQPQPPRRGQGEDSRPRGAGRGEMTSRAQSGVAALQTSRSALSAREGRRPFRFFEARSSDFCPTRKPVFARSRPPVPCLPRPSSNFDLWNVGSYQRWCVHVLLWSAPKEVFDHSVNGSRPAERRSRSYSSPNTDDVRATNAGATRARAIGASAMRAPASYRPATHMHHRHTTIVPQAVRGGG
jgi:hypothetical protein